MQSKIKETTKMNNEMNSLPDGDVNLIKPQRSFAQACKESNAVSMEEFMAEWMRQLELRFKNTSSSSQSND